jgi:hypothetical protein
MKRIFTDEQVHAGDVIPDWYGISYYDYTKNTAVCYLFGLHLLVRWGNSLYWWLVWKRPSRRENDLEQAYNLGQEHGGLEGYTRGYGVGYKAGRESTLAEHGVIEGVSVHSASIHRPGSRPGTVAFFAEVDDE